MSFFVPMIINFVPISKTINVIEKFKKSGYVNVRSNNTPVAVSGCRPKL